MSLHAPEKSSAKRVLLLQGVFVVGFLLVFGLEQVFSNLMEELAQVSQNHRAKLFIGEQISLDINAIEMDVYRMAVSTGNNTHARFQQSIDEHVSNIHLSLSVLEKGGELSRTIHLNLESADQMVKKVNYVPDATKSYAMELIEIAPLVDQINQKTSKLRELLALRENMRMAKDNEELSKFEAQVKLYIKQLPPFFIRLRENANRLTYETQLSLDALEQDLAQQKDRYLITKYALMVLVLLSVVAVGLIFARQINESNRQLTLAWEAMLRSKQEAENASRAKSDFVSRMSHELRTPLNAILGFAQLLGMDDLPEHQKEPVNQINRAGNHLLELINQVLDIAKIEAGKLEVESLVIDLPQLLRDTAAIGGERARSKGLNFVVDVDERLPDAVMSDPTRLRQVLINLIGNAIKFTDEGEIRIAARLEENNNIHFDVFDSGIGMSPSALGRLFKPFSQADESITRRYGGTGLGLMLCKEIVEALGGEIGVDSEIGKGSHFWFDIPLVAVPVSSHAQERPSQASHDPIKQSSEAQNDALSLADKRVLLVEDNLVNQMVATKLLNKLGIKPDIANHGEEALSLLSKNPYDMVLLDLEMPVMDGYTTIAKIRENENYDDYHRHQLVVAMSANALNEDKQRAFGLGMDDYLTKPVNFGALQTMLEKWLLAKS